MTEPAAKATDSGTHRHRKRRTNWRVVIVRFAVDVVMIALVLGLMPGIRTEFELSFLSIALMAVIYGLLNAFVRPAFDLLLSPFVVQTYGLAVVIVDVAIFGLLLLFTGGIEVKSILTVIIGGILLGVLQVTAAGFLGLTPPVVSGGVRRQPTELGLLRFSVRAEERLRLLRVRQTLRDHGLDALFDGDGPIARFRRRMQTWLWQPSEPLVRLPAPVRFRLLLQDLGPTYVKIGQIISSRARTLPVE